VRIDCEGEFLGTGFLAAPGEVLTCAHVLQGHREVRVSQRRWRGKATVVTKIPDDDSAQAEGFYPFPDLALLRVEDAPADLPCVSIDADAAEAVREGEVLHMFGFSRGEYEPGSVTGSPASMEYEGRLTGDGFEVLKLGHDQVLPGYSGSPVLNLASGTICGIIDSTRDPSVDLGGFAIPVSALTPHLPELLERNSQHHATDPRWGLAHEAEAVAVRQQEEAEPLPLLPPTVKLEWHPDLAQSELLRPRYGVVGLVGRTQLLDELMLWRESDHPLRVTLVTGGGGFGKTRLGLEVCEQARRAGWTAGLLTIDDSADVDRELRRLVSWPGRCCVAIDYAEAKPALVSSLIGRLLRRHDGPPFRLVLICRQAQSKRELEGLFATGEGREDVAAVLRTADPIQLDRHEIDRRLLFEEGTRAFAEQLGRPAPEPPRISLAGEHFSRVLFVLSAALLVASDPAVDVESMSWGELLSELINRHEAQYWQKMDERLDLHLDPAIRRRAVAAATVLGAADEDEALALVRFLPGLEEATAERRREVARWLSNLYGSATLDQEPVVGPVEPDMLGETLVRSEYRSNPKFLAATLDAASDHQLTRGLTVLSRAAVGCEPLETALRAALDERLPAFVARASAAHLELAGALDLAVNTIQPLSGAARVMRESGAELGALGALGRSVTEQAVTYLEGDDSDSNRIELARSLSLLAVFLGNSGRPDDAVTAAERAVQMFRELREQEGDEHLPALSRALDRLVSAQDWQATPGAVDTAEELVAVARELAEQDPSQRLRVAEGMNALASANGKRGRPKEALEAAKGAVRIYREVESDDFVDVSQLASALSNLSVAWGELGRPTEALEAAKEAASLRMRLFEARPDSSRHLLAVALNNLSVAYSRVGLAEEALAVNEESIQQFQILAEGSSLFLPELAMGLSNQSSRLYALGRSGEALPVIEQAVARYREMTSLNPEMHVSQLATALTNLTVILSDLGRFEEGLVACEEAVGHRRKLVKERRVQYLPDLADDLTNMTAILGQMERTAEAKEVIEEAIAHYRELIDLGSEQYRADIAMALNNYAIILSDSEEHEKALAAIDEAVGHFQSLARENEALFLPQLASALSTRASRLMRLERYDDALEANQTALDRYEALAERFPERFVISLAGCLNNRANCLSLLDRPDDALAVAERAMEQYRSPSAPSSERFFFEFVTCLSTYAGILATLGRIEEAAKAFEEAAAEKREHPSGWLIGLAEARWWRRQEKYEKALAAAWKAQKLKQENGGDPAGKVRIFLCALRAEDEPRFDELWRREVDEDQPIWLRHPNIEEKVRDLLVAWLRTPDWIESRTFLEENSALLLSDQAVAGIAHLLDNRPGNVDLRRHERLQHSARREGVAEAYAELIGELEILRRHTLLMHWVTLEAEEAQKFLQKNKDELLKEASEQELIFAAQSADEPMLVGHAGLICLARLEGVEHAYSSLASPHPGLRIEDCLGSSEEPRVLAMARLQAAMRPDDSEGHFLHALAATAAGRQSEAEDALGRCGESASTWERREFRRQLKAVEEAGPQFHGLAARAEDSLADRLLPDAPASA